MRQKWVIDAALEEAASRALVESVESLHPLIVVTEVSPSGNRICFEVVNALPDSIENQIRNMDGVRCLHYDQAL